MLRADTPASRDRDIGISSQIYLLQLESNLICIVWFSLTGKMYRGLGEFSKSKTVEFGWNEYL